MSESDRNDDRNVGRINVMPSALEDHGQHSANMHITGGVSLFSSSPICGSESTRSRHRPDVEGDGGVTTETSRWYVPLTGLLPAKAPESQPYCSGTRSCIVLLSSPSISGGVRTSSL